MRMVDRTNKVHVQGMHFTQNSLSPPLKLFWVKCFPWACTLLVWSILLIFYRQLRLFLVASLVSRPFTQSSRANTSSRENEISENGCFDNHVVMETVGWSTLVLSNITQDVSWMWVEMWSFVFQFELFGTRRLKILSHCEKKKLVVVLIIRFFARWQKKLIDEQVKRSRRSEF